ncbi:MAG: cyclic nucleotide-binding domain-containing protein, partial [Chloroflexota bacterium]
MPERFEANIRMLPLFAKLPPQQLEWARQAMRVMRFEQGEMVFQQGETSRGLYMFLQGRARLIREEENGQQRVLGEIGPNQYLNEAALFRAGTETATLQVIERATVLFVSRKELMRVISDHPEMQDNLPVPKDAIRARQARLVFPGQRDNEEVVLHSRRHWWWVARRIWIPFFMFVGLLVAAGLMPSAGLALALGALGIVIPGAFTAYLFLEWHNDHVIITDQRVIHIEQVIHSLREVRSEVPLASIQQINADIITADPFSRVFNYGRVVIRTAGDAGNITLTLIPDPDGVQDLIFKHRNSVTAREEREQRNVIRAEVDKVLGRTDEQHVREHEQHQEEALLPEIKADPPRGPLDTRWVNDDGDTVYRKHVIFWARQVFYPLVILSGAGVMLVLSGNIGPIGLLLAAFLGVVGLLWLWWADWDWRHDRYIVGDQMIQLIHKRPLFLQNEDDQVLLDRVDNVTANKSGLLQTVFNYGDVAIALVGSDPSDMKIFRAVPQPGAVQAEITRRQSRWRTLQQLEDERRRRDEISDYLSVYHESVQERYAMHDPYRSGGEPGPAYGSQGAPA